MIRAVLSAVRTPVFCAKCYWPGITESDLADVAMGVRREAALLDRAGVAVAYRGSILFRDDDVVLCIFAAASRGAVLLVNERAQVPSERIMESVWLPAVDPSEGS